MKEAGPVLGVYGENDQDIPQEQVNAFKKSLTARGVEHTVTVYPGVGHAFVRSDTYNQGGAPQKAWEQAVAFINEHLK
jgi:carboxymethylenebutenolidase